MRSLSTFGALMLAYGILVGFRILGDAGPVLPWWFIPAGGAVLLLYGVFQQGPERLGLVITGATFMLGNLAMPSVVKALLWCVAGATVFVIGGRASGILSSKRWELWIIGVGLVLAILFVGL